MSFAYKGTFVVDDAKVPSTQTNFPVLVSVTDNALKTVGNGGQVQNSSGYDIRWYSDSGLTSAINFELESFDGTAGTIVFWVSVASLTGTGGGDTTFYCGIGDAALNTNASSTGTWDSNFRSVYHLADNAANTTVHESTSNAFTGTAGTNTSNLASTGQIGSGFLGDLTNAVTNGDTTVVHHTDPFTISAWFKTTDDTLNGQVIAAYYDFAGNGFDLKYSTNQTFYGSLYYNGAQIINYGVPNGSVFQNIWYHATITYDGSASGAGAYGYVNGGTQTAGSGSLPSGTSFGNSLRMLVQPGLSQLKGSLDEVRISSIARSADWIATEYNNQSAPTVGNFFTSIAFAANSGGASVVPVLMSQYRRRKI